MKKGTHYSMLMPPKAELPMIMVNIGDSSFRFKNYKELMDWSTQQYHATHALEKVTNILNAIRWY